MKAKTIKFDYAGTQIEGLLMPDGEYRIAVSQVVKLLNLATPNHATKTVKRILGKDSPLPQKVASDLNSNKVNTIDFTQFAKIVRYADKVLDNELAASMMEASQEFTITQAFEVAMGIERTNIEGARMYSEMVESKRIRRDFTDSAKLSYEKTGSLPDYAHITYNVYKKLGLHKAYVMYTEQYNKTQRKTITFRHHFLSPDDRFLISRAEENIYFCITKLGMTFQEAVDKL